MSAFTSAWTDPVVEDWEQDDYVRTDKLRDQSFQNLVYLKTAVDSVVSTNYWQIYEQQLQAGHLPGNPLA